MQREMENLAWPRHPSGFTSSTLQSENYFSRSNHLLGKKVIPLVILDPQSPILSILSYQAAECQKPHRPVSPCKEHWVLIASVLFPVWDKELGTPPPPSQVLSKIKKYWNKLLGNFLRPPINVLNLSHIPVIWLSVPDPFRELH